jgi:hypothetical protein
MSLTEFINNEEVAINFIEESLREFESFDDNAYWFHFNFDEDEDEIESTGSHTNAEYTIFCDCDGPYIEYITEVGKKYGYELMTKNDILKHDYYKTYYEDYEDFDEEEIEEYDFDDYDEEDKAVWWRVNSNIIDRFWDKVVDDFEHSDEFYSVASVLYNLALEKILD